MVRSLSAHTRAVLQALLVTFLWSTSWVLIKFGLEDIAIPALTFAGLRYGLAWLCLLPVAFGSRRQRTETRAALRALTRADWLLLITLGIVMYTLTQGAQFLSLERLPAMTLSLLLSFSPVMVALLGAILLGERVTRGQQIGLALYLLGAAIYFYPGGFASGEVIGLVIGAVGMLANASAALLGRHANRGARFSPLLVTVVSMGIGSVLLLGSGIAAQGLPRLGVQGVAIIGWLALVNTAFAFTLWNHTQRTLAAVETSIINNTMLIQIALLAWLFLGEALGPRAIVGLVLAALGTLIVQLRRAALA